VHARVLLAGYLSNQWAEFKQTVADDVVEATDELYVVYILYTVRHKNTPKFFYHNFYNT